LAKFECCAEDDVRFDRDIRPILADNCFACHGPDKAASESELRLDQKESIFADLGGYAAVVPGDAKASELVRRILSDDADEVMPPADHRKKLDARQKQLLVDWVEQGARWTDHWAFVPPLATSDPAVTHPAWPVNYVDCYILAELERRGIEPSPVADDRTLARRLSFDLTGLPPTADELANCQFCLHPESYEAAVDHWLASRHFGERLAVYWLDLVRYADSVGYHGDQPISVSPYRDYVVRAFNNDMPFDQFTCEQIAGDLLDQPTRDQLVASGYNRLGMMSAEGGVQPEEYLNKYASDRVRTTATAWLGVTLGCAECHDHKFDPLPTREFYEFSAFFADIKERGLYEGAHESKDWGPHIEVPSDELASALEPFDQQLSLLRQSIQETPGIEAGQNSWEHDLAGQKFVWTIVRPDKIGFAEATGSTVADDGSVLVHGDNPDENCTVLTLSIPEPGARAIRLEALPHESLPGGGAGRAANGNFVVTELLAVRGDHSAEVSELKKVFALWPESQKTSLVPLRNASATIEQAGSAGNHPDKKWSAASTIDHDARGSTWGWAVLPDASKPNELVVQIADDQELAGEITLVIQQYHGQGSHTLGHFRVSVSYDGEATADPLHSLPAGVKQALAVAAPDRNEDQRRAIREYYVSVAPTFEETNRRIADLESRRAGIVDWLTPTSPITVSVPPREIRILPRGNWMDQSGAVVAPNVPMVLGRPDWQGRPTRLELATWIASDSNPLTARVFVNRIWAMFMGSGLAPMLDDFGAQGTAPSHPELLDRLAIEFVKSGWDVKQLIRTIVTSQTYRQSSAWREDLKSIDPENRLLARQSRFRLQAEFIRDNVLATSGLLYDRPGGRSVYPYQPAGLYRNLNFPRREYMASSGDEQYRRGLYTHWQRQYLHPAMKTFDAPSREECQAARPRSSTPLGALVMLNDPSYVEAARALADLAITSSEGDQDRIEFVFMRALSRPPSEAECEVLRELLDSHRRQFGEDQSAAARLNAVGQYRAAGTASLAELAAWTSLCRTVINMHEFIQRN
jgi:hypothetical protein